MRTVIRLAVALKISAIVGESHVGKGAGWGLQHQAQGQLQAARHAVWLCEVPSRSQPRPTHSSHTVLAAYSDCAE